MRGTIITRGRRHSVVVDVGRGPDGKRLRKWHSGPDVCKGHGGKVPASCKTAELARTAILRSLDQGTYVEPIRLTLGVFLSDKWLPAVAATLRAGTLSMYRTNIEAHISPGLGHVALRALTADALNIFYGELLTDGRRDGRGGLSARTVRINHVILHRALRDATRWGLLARNVAELADPPRSESKEVRAWSPEQTAAFLASTGDDRLAALWVLTASTGMRRGEVCGLRWCDTDLDEGHLVVAQTIVVVNYRLVVSEPKSRAGKRTLALDPRTVAALRAHRARQLEERLSWGELWSDEGLVFVREDGRPIHPERLSKWFAQRVRRAALPRLTFHGLRHSYVTMLLRAGQPLHVVAKRAGHSSPNVTSAVYSHVLPGDDEAAALAGARALGGA
jgi:integrase